MNAKQMKIAIKWAGYNAQIGNMMVNQLLNAFLGKIVDQDGYKIIRFMTSNVMGS